MYNDTWFLKASAADLQKALAAGDFTSVALVQRSLAQVAKYDRQGPELRAMMSQSPAAVGIAEQLDKERASGKVRGPFHGIPMIVKVGVDVVWAGKT